VSMDIPAFERRAHEEWARQVGDLDMVPMGETAAALEWRALRHALAEFDVPVYRVGPAVPLAEALAS